jgi:hypothetical protein
MFMIFLWYIRMSDHSGLLVFVCKTSSEENFHITAMPLFYIIQTSILTKVAYVLKI